MWPSACSSASAPRARCPVSTSRASADRRSTGSANRTNIVRAVLEAYSRHRRARARATRRQPTVLRRHRATTAGKPARARDPDSRNRLRHKLLSRYRAHGLLGVGGGGDIFGGIGPAKPDPRLPGISRANGLREELIATGELVPVEVANVRGKRFAVKADVDLLERPPTPPPSVAFLLSVRSARLGPSPPRISVRVRLRLGALHPAGQATLGLVRAADALSRPARRPDRAAHRQRRRPVQVLGLWWEDGFEPRRAEGFVDAMRDALRAYLRFAGATRLEWAPHLARERRLFLTRP